MKKKSNKISLDIFTKNKNNIFYSSIILFLITSIILSFIPKNVGSVLTYFIFPIYFFLYTLLHIKGKKINYDFPIVLTIIYLIIGYIFIHNIISPLKIIIAYLSSMIPILVYRFDKKLKKKNIKFEEKEEIFEENKSFVSNILPFIFVVTLELYFTICTFGIAHLPSNILTITL